MWKAHLPIPEADPDPLRRGIRSAWRHTHWLLAGSALWAVGLLVAVHSAQGSVARAVVTAAVLTLPGTALLTVIASRIVLHADCDVRAIRSIRGRTWLRVVHVPLVGAAVVLTGSGSVVAYPAMPPVLAWPTLTLSTVALLAYVLLAPTAAALALHRRRAPHARLWLVAFLATSARPVPVLGGLSAVGTLAVVAWHVQILLFLAPGLAAIVLTASAWVVLPRVGIAPTAPAELVAAQDAQPHRTGHRQSQPTGTNQSRTLLDERNAH